MLLIIRIHYSLTTTVFGKKRQRGIAIPSTINMFVAGLALTGVILGDSLIPNPKHGDVTKEHDIPTIDTHPVLPVNHTDISQQKDHAEKLNNLYLMVRSDTQEASIEEGKTGESSKSDHQEKPITPFTTAVTIPAFLHCVSGLGIGFSKALLENKPYDVSFSALARTPDIANYILYVALHKAGIGADKKMFETMGKAGTTTMLFPMMFASAALCLTLGDVVKRIGHSNHDYSLKVLYKQADKIFKDIGKDKIDNGLIAMGTAISLASPALFSAWKEHPLKGYVFGAGLLTMTVAKLREKLEGHHSIEATIKICTATLAASPALVYEKGMEKEEFVALCGAGMPLIDIACNALAGDKNVEDIAQAMKDKDILGAFNSLSKLSFMRKYMSIAKELFREFYKHEAPDVESLEDIRRDSFDDTADTEQERAKSHDVPRTQSPVELPERRPSV